MAHAVCARAATHARVTEALVRHLRNAFLSLMAPELVILPSDQVDAIAAARRRARRRRRWCGRSRCSARRWSRCACRPTRASSPRWRWSSSPTTRPAPTSMRLLARIERLENTRQAAARGGAAVGLAAVAGPNDPTTGRAVLGGARAGTRRPPAPTRQARQRRPAAAAAAAAGRRRPAQSPGDVGARGVGADRQGPGQADHPGALLGRLVRRQQRRRRGSSASPTRPTAPSAQEHRPAVEAALAKAVGEPVTVEFVVGGRRPRRRARHPSPAIDRSPAAGPTIPAAEEIDLSELTDAPPETVRTPIDRLAEAFPGSEFVTEA